MSTLMHGLMGRRSLQKAQPEEEVSGLACRYCGILVTDPNAPVETLEAEQTEVRLSAVGGKPGMLIVREQSAETQVTTCETCRQRVETAARMMERHPSLLFHYHHAPTRSQVADAALMVLDALGVEWRGIDTEQVLTKRLRLIFRRLPSVAYGVAWSGKFAPVLRADVKPGSYAAREHRWAHLTGEQRSRLTEAYGALLQDAIDGPRSVAPPRGEDGRTADVRGCLLCGIGNVTVLASEAAHAWGALRRVDPKLVGGERRPQPIQGYLCPRCRVAAEGHGIGMTAVENSICDYLGISGRARDRFETLRVAKGARMEVGETDGTSLTVSPAAWCALPPRTPINGRPWQHLGDLSELRESLERL